MLSSVGSTWTPSYTTASMPNWRHLVGDPLRVTGRGDARVGDHEDATHVVLEQVVADLVGGAGPELQLRVLRR